MSYLKCPTNFSLSWVAKSLLRFNEALISEVVVSDPRQTKVRRTFKI